MEEITRLLDLCHFAGERFDLVQAAGGNASLVMDDGIMWIKTSGLSLSEIVSENELCRVSVAEPKALVAKLASEIHSMSDEQIDDAVNACLKSATKSDGKNPSNEWLLHSALGPYTLHTHPPVVTSVVCQRGWEARVINLIPKAIFVKYHTPGAKLAAAVARALKERNWTQGEKAVIFLENHGLIVSAKSAADVANITNEVVATLSYFLGLDWSRYRLSNRVSDLMYRLTGERVSSYYCEDQALIGAIRRNSSVLLAQAVFPDQVAYCGPAGIELTSLDDEKTVESYVEKYGQLPRVLLYKASSDHIFLIGPSIKKCRQMEEVLKAHILTLSATTMANVQFLSEDEMTRLSRNEAEKHRMTV